MNSEIRPYPELLMSKGNYTLELDHDQHLVHVNALGDFDRELGELLITAARQKAREFHYNILCDVRQSEAQVTLADWFFLPRKLPVYKEQNTRFIRTAIIAGKGEQAEKYGFFETVARNVGLNIKIFYQKDEALQWLASDH